MDLDCLTNNWEIIIGIITVIGMVIAAVWKFFTYFDLKKTDKNKQLFDNYHKYINMLKDENTRIIGINNLLQKALKTPKSRQEFLEEIQNFLVIENPSFQEKKINNVIMQATEEVLRQQTKELSQITKEKRKKYEHALSFEGFTFIDINFSFKSNKISFLQTETNFKNCKFYGKADFYGTRFSGDALFQKSIFYGEAKFDNVKFYGDVNFGEVQFKGRIVFGNICFGGINKKIVFPKLKNNADVNCSFNEKKYKISEEIKKMLKDYKWVQT